MTLLMASAVACIMVLGLMTQASASVRQSCLILTVLTTLISSPFTLKTAAGRLWWATWLLAISSVILAVRSGIHNPLSWLCVLIASCGYAIGVCLRWKSDPNRKPASF